MNFCDLCLLFVFLILYFFCFVWSSQDNDLQLFLELIVCPNFLYNLCFLLYLFFEAGFFGSFVPCFLLFNVFYCVWISSRIRFFSFPIYETIENLADSSRIRYNPLISKEMILEVNYIWSTLSYIQFSVSVRLNLFSIYGLKY